ncbi:MAG: ATP-binding cassette domain-containing protein, partial [Rhodobacteraceae bacterium]|nr:ATP-binding cassette domain-containing protein [Paracoccaceae bacterium]
MNDPHVVVDALDITYRDDGGHETHAVRRASLTLARGETLGIVGESGSGKSTLARALMGYARPGARFAGGSVRVGCIEAVPPTSAAARALQGRRVAMV